MQKHLMESFEASEQERRELRIEVYRVRDQIELGDLNAQAFLGCALRWASGKPNRCDTAYHAINSRAAKRGVSNGGVSRSGLVLPFLSFFVLFGTFPIFLGFSRFGRGWSGDFPDWSFSSLSAY